MKDLTSAICVTELSAQTPYSEITLTHTLVCRIKHFTIHCCTKYQKFCLSQVWNLTNAMWRGAIWLLSQAENSPDTQDTFTHTKNHFAARCVIMPVLKLASCEDIFAHTQEKDPIHVMNAGMCLQLLILWILRLVEIHQRKIWISFCLYIVFVNIFCTSAGKHLQTAFI